MLKGVGITSLKGTVIKLGGCPGLSCLVNNLFMILTTKKFPNNKRPGGKQSKVADCVQILTSSKSVMLRRGMLVSLEEGVTVG